ncbi:MAG: hypothetical protein WAO91_05090 [Candidatus Nitrosotenuis sp.]
MSKEHQDQKSLIKHLIDHFLSLGLEVQYADYEGYQKPFIINRHAPDIIAFDRKKQLGYIGKAKTRAELVEKTTKEQLSDFSKRLMKTGNSERARLPFFIAVPHDCNSKITQTLKELHLDSRDNIHIIGF